MELVLFHKNFLGNTLLFLAWIHQILYSKLRLTMSLPNTLNTDLFCNEVNFLQKIVLFHPTDSHKFLALKRSASDESRPNDWDLVGGHVIFGEENEESLHREAREEADIEISGIHPIQVTTIYQKEGKVCKLFIGYEGIANTEVIHISTEHSSYMWVTSEEFRKLTQTSFLLDLVAIATKNV